MDLRQPRPQSRGAQTQPQTASRVASEPTASKTPSRRSIPKIWKIIAGAVWVLALVAAIVYYGFGFGSPVDRSKYQAVFLSNGQVYFGKLSGWGTSQPILTDVYYFQAGEAPRGGADGEDQQPAEGTQTLVKLGEEIHKPTDKLILNKDAVLFVENIEDDGQVVDAIKQNQ